MRKKNYTKDQRSTLLVSVTTSFITTFIGSALNLSVPDLSLIHISEPTRQAEISYAVFCLKKKKKPVRHQNYDTTQQKLTLMSTDSTVNTD